MYPTVAATSRSVIMMRCDGDVTLRRDFALSRHNRQRCFWAPWCIYLHDYLAASSLSGCIVAFILFCDEVEHYIGVFTDWYKAKVEILHQVHYGELTTFLGLADWATRFAEDGVNWNNVLPEGTRIRAHYAPALVIDGGSFPVGIHLLLINRDFQEQYAHFLADAIARCWVWTTEPQ
jgi:hypothetical protein